MSDNAPPQEDPGARKAVGGVIYFTFAKIYFMAAGYAVTFGLPVMFRRHALAQGMGDAAALAQSVALFGKFGLVNSAVSVINMILIDGTRYTVSRFVSKDEGNGAAVRRAALALQAAVGATLTSAYFLSAPLLARAFDAPDLENAFRVSALIPIAYTFYAVFRGYLNGMQAFLKEAALDISFSTLKPLSMLALAYLGYGVFGAMGGFALAAMIIMVAAFVLARGGGAVRPVRWRELWSFEYRIILYTALFYLLINCDWFLIGNLLRGVEGDQLKGRYYAQLSLARIVWQGTFAITVVLFPLVSKVVAEGDPDRTRRYVSQALRFTLLIAGFLAAVFSANAPSIVEVVFGVGFTQDALPMRIMAFSKLAFALLMVVSTVLSGSGKPLHAAALIGSTLLIAGPLNLVAIPRWQLVGAATATGTAVTITAFAGLTYLYRRFGAHIPLGSLLRIGAAMAVTWGVGHQVDLGGKAMDFLECALLGVLYLGVIFGLREIKLSELASLRA